MGAVVLFWAILVAGSLVNRLAAYDQYTESVALARARMLFDVIETTRLWNAHHGGVYVEVDPETPPNPYLKVPDRELYARGKTYTLVNPAYMTRQISDLVRQRQDVWFHITSLDPLNPANLADPWETKVLQRFEQGEREVLEQFDDRDGEFRYMRALITEEPCMACHKEQGYKIGDIRGGISVTMPAEKVVAELGGQRAQTILLHGIVFLLLAGGSVLALKRLNRAWTALAKARDDQERLVITRTAELRQVNRKLIESNRELEQFAYVASHDLQEPLRMVAGYGKLLSRRYGEQLDGEGREFLHYMTDSAARMQQMINDLLAYSRLDRTELTPTALDPREPVNLALKNLSFAIEDAGAVIDVDLPHTVQGDGALLARLFQNLIGNALKYRADDRTPHIQIGGETSAQGWTLWVRDNGPGIPAEARERVFQVFQRLHGDDTHRGTGMGLAICRRIAVRHGGRLWVESNGDAPGATFKLFLPRPKTPSTNE